MIRQGVIFETTKSDYNSLTIYKLFNEVNNRHLEEYMIEGLYKEGNVFYRLSDFKKKTIEDADNDELVYIYQFYMERLDNNPLKGLDNIEVLVTAYDISNQLDYGRNGVAESYENNVYRHIIEHYIEKLFGESMSYELSTIMDIEDKKGRCFNISIGHDKGRLGLWSNENEVTGRAFDSFLVEETGEELILKVYEGRTYMEQL